jgi:hypothetical protein
VTALFDFQISFLLLDIVLLLHWSELLHFFVDALAVGSGALFELVLVKLQLLNLRRYFVFHVFQ